MDTQNDAHDDRKTRTVRQTAETHADRIPECLDRGHTGLRTADRHFSWREVERAVPTREGR